MRHQLTHVGIILVVLFALILESCSSGKGAYQQGDYYQAVMTSANRLRRNDNHKKSVQTLSQAYPLAITFYENQVGSASGPFKWRAVVQSYTYLQAMYNEIQTSPGALKVIPNPKNYAVQLADAREKAAEESYSAGVVALNMGTREKAKEAHVLFVAASEYVNGYKDVNKKIEEAKWAATLKVLVEPLPSVARNFDVNAEYFNNRMSEQLRASNINEYVAFFSPQEVKTRGFQPDHVVRFGFDEFSIGQTYLKETQIPMERDSLGNAVATTPAAGLTIQEKPQTVPAVIPVATKPTPTPTETSPTQSGNTQSVPQNSPPTTEPATETPSTSQPQSSSQSASTAQSQTTPGTTPSPAPVETIPAVVPAAGAGAAIGTKPVEPTNTPTEPTPTPNSGDDEKVVICHNPPGNTANRKAMSIPRSALQAHLDHGDYIGDCKNDAIDEEKAKAEKEKADKEKADKEKADKEKADKEKADKEKADKEKKKDNNNNNLYALSGYDHQNLMASIRNDGWAIDISDTTSIVTTFKATVKHFQKTITSKGVLDVKIFDAKSNAVVRQQKMPSEYIWKSEWATYTGDERALTPEQVKLTRQSELRPPSQQDLFKQFTEPLLGQVIDQLKAFYSSY